MYELLLQYVGIGRREFEIPKLKETLGLEGEYPDIDNFKRRVIDVSVKQINAHTDITTSYTQRKTGRNVTHLNFKIDAKEAAPKVVKRPSLTRAYVEKHALPTGRKLGSGAGTAAGGARTGVEGEWLKKRMEQQPPQGMAGEWRL